MQSMSRLRYSQSLDTKGCSSLQPGPYDLDVCERRVNDPRKHV